MPSDAPQDWVFDHAPLRAAVEGAAGTGAFLPDPRIRVEKLTLGSNQIPSEATLAVYAGPIDSIVLGQEPRLSIAGVFNAQGRPGHALAFIGPDQEILVYLERASGVLLFSGYCHGPQYEERSAKTGATPRSDRLFHLRVYSMLERLSAMPQAQIAGRRMRTAKGQDDLDAEQERSDTTPQGDVASVVLVRSCPCVFNAGGKPNRAAAPVTVTIGGTAHLIHVFTYDGDPDAETWTWAQALRYLLLFHLPESHAGAAITELPGPLKDGNGFSRTEGLVSKAITDRPSAPPETEEAWEYAMLGEAREFNCERLNLPEALIVLADAAGVRFWVKTEAELDENGDPTGRPVNRLYWRARGEGPEKTLLKEATFADRGRPAAVLLRKTNVKDLSIEADSGDIVTDPVFLGDVRRYEVTVELVPGWEPDAHLDNVAPGSVDEELLWAEEHRDLDEEDIQDDPWFQQYHKGGMSFASYASVGRRWVLNETGRYRAADYAHTTGLYNADAYLPWEPSRAGITDRVIDDNGDGALVDVAVGDWVRKARPFQPCFTADSEGRSLGIVVEFSFDAGETWVKIPSARIINLEDEAGIYIDSDDLTEIQRPGDDTDGTHLWEAILMDSLRVRVTAVIDGDKRLEPNVNLAALSPPPSLPTGRVFDLSDRFRSNRRDGGNSQFKDSELPCVSEATDDLEILQSTAEAVADLLMARQIALSATVPWLTTDYEVMDSVQRITGINLAFRTYGPGRSSKRTDIVAIEYSEAHTRLIFEDPRKLTQVEF